MSCSLLLHSAASSEHCGLVLSPRPFIKQTAHEVTPEQHKACMGHGEAMPTQTSSPADLVSILFSFSVLDTCVSLCF